MEVPCAECGKLFGAGSHMNKHIQVAHHPENQKKVCSLCSLEFSNRYRLYQHMKRVHGKVPCTRCGNLFFAKCMNKHISTAHNGEKLFKCTECNKLFFAKSRMNRHIQSAHTPDDQKKFRCNTCDKGFISNQYLLEHTNVHSGEKPFKCTECAKLFVAKSRLNRHIRSAHTPDDQKNYKCDTCGKGFINKQHFSDHLNIHTGEKPHKCKFCPADFANGGALRAHVKHKRLGFCVLIFFSILPYFLSQEKVEPRAGQFWNDKIYQNINFTVAQLLAPVIYLSFSLIEIYICERIERKFETQNPSHRGLIDSGHK